ncbi:hypothetical protein BE11_03520 [Sorangium cellulosum]|nr:hypothetical protein BE11_03520 [Sorangium cellulosum]
MRDGGSRGELPLTQGIAGGARDLAEVARGALHDLEVPQRSLAGADLPPPRRDRFRVWRDWLDAEPAGAAGRDPPRRRRGREGALRALGDHGRGAGLAEEVGAFLGERKDQRAAVIASYLLTL